MPWKTLLANVTGSVDEELRLRIEYLVTENRILRSKLTDRIRFKEEERRELAAIGKQLGRKALEAIATIVKPATILRCTPIWSPESSMVPATGSLLDDRRYPRKSNNSS